MIFERFNVSQTDQVTELFRSVFSDSEGKKQGELIASLVKEMIETTDSEALKGYIALLNDQIIGAIFFSKFTVPSSKKAFILSPVAVAVNQQKKGIGQQLINHGVEKLKVQGVELLLTYGDPKFYSKVGFQQVNDTLIKAPKELSFPEGWLAQPLEGSSIFQENGATYCIKALNKRIYW